MVRKSQRNNADRKNEAKREDNLANKIVKWLFAGLIAFVLLICLYGVFLITVGGIGNKDEVKVDVPVGASASSVASQLEDQNVIANASLFNLYQRIKGGQGVQAGTYTMHENMSMQSALKTLNAGSQSGEVYRLVIPEGTNLEGISQIVEENSDYTAEEFMEVATDEKFFQKMQSLYPDMLAEVAEKDDVRYKLEGYLFPATYEIGAGESIEEIIDKMVGQMNQVYNSHIDQVNQSDYSFHELLTLASLVEAEAPETADRQLIAGIFINRLNTGMPIQSDISISYALNEHRPYVTYEDTEVDSPYNLYQNPGLGPGPFNSPGLEAIEASLAPEPSDYLYFVADLQTGEVYYAETYEEHLALVDQYVSEENANM
ncbi:endolytic transglycosylase MltG [Aerococcus kribbianus]|uniref:Endolytic murein transglycosylase n=1 Tax=Aerococcus kribbianus TaxID=2999064 RepID=A0A9X3JEK5_9LACT|nr:MULTISPECIES: endolytic transglycosylase MltG [unclassified Aerococcus]MCZ0716703.1 endolytic transglycosylase MltG [Aerococcus sp. YH-aer221]MCZ0724991.1 endolytic transglycosylase MltG [Aerococcus sp. YH-aer222]